MKYFQFQTISGDMLQETSKLRAGGHGFGNSEPPNQSCGSRSVHHGNREKAERKVSATPADHTRVPYSQQHHHYHHQRHTSHPRAPQHNTLIRPLEEKDSRSHHHRQSTVRAFNLSLMSTPPFQGQGSFEPCLIIHDAANQIIIGKM